MEKPILFNTDMVRAILDGRKTVTRRIFQKKIVDAYYSYDDWCSSVMPSDIPCTRSYENDFFMDRAKFKVGDFLYVRETFSESCPHGMDECPSEKPKQADRLCNVCQYNKPFYYKADGVENEYVKWHPSIHMPKQAARIWLKVTNVRVERLQDMYVDDAIKEGAWGGGVPHIPFSVLSDKYPNSCNAVASFAHIWDSAIKKSDIAICGWKANPFVWVIEFERCKKPEQDGAE